MFSFLLNHHMCSVRTATERLTTQYTGATRHCIDFNQSRCTFFIFFLEWTQNDKRVFLFSLPPRLGEEDVRSCEKINKCSAKWSFRTFWNECSILVGFGVVAAVDHSARQRSKHSEAEPIRIQVSDLLNFRINSHRPLTPLFPISHWLNTINDHLSRRVHLNHRFSWALSTTQTHHWNFSISDAVRTATPPTGVYS